MLKKDFTKVIQLTQQGVDELKAELTQLIDIKLPQAIARVAEARSHGDLKENAEYQDARDEQQLIQARIDEIQEILESATIVQSTSGHNKIGVGSVVKVRLLDKKSTSFTYTIVGEFEANPLEGRISIDSPLGKAMVGSKKGETIKVKAPAGEIQYEVIEIK